MGAPEDFESLKRRLVEHSPDMPKRLRQVAAFAVDHPDEVALGTAASVAAGAQVQASTLVRFAQALGYRGFSDLQAIFRSQLRGRWPDYSDRLKALHARNETLEGPAKLLVGFSDAATASLNRLKETVRADDLERALAVLAAADVIYIFAQRRSFGVAHYLYYALSQLKVRSYLVDNIGGLGPEQIRGVGARDAVLAISFAPYSPVTVEYAKAAKAAGASVVAITDSVLSPLARSAAVCFEVAEHDYGAFRSLSATMCLALTLAVGAADFRTAGAAKKEARRGRPT